MDLGAFVHTLENATMHLNIYLWTRFNERDSRTHTPRLPHACADFHAKTFGIVASRDHAGAIRLDGDHSHGTASQLGAEILLNRSKVGVHVRQHPVHDSPPPESFH